MTNEQKRFGNVSVIFKTFDQNVKQLRVPKSYQGTDCHFGVEIN